MILIFIGYPAVGDLLSTNGMINFLSKFYEKIYLLDVSNCSKYLCNLYHLKENIIYDNFDINKVLNTKKKIHWCDCRYEYNINRDDKISKLKDITNLELFRIDCLNFKINDLLTIDNKYIFDKEKEKLIDNSTGFYKHINLNKSVKLDFFHFNRNLEKEIEVCEEILLKHNLDEFSKFNIICDCDIPIRGDYLEMIDKKHINNNFTNININRICEFPGLLIPLFNRCEEIHLVANSNSLLIYYLQYKKIIDPNKKVYFHHYCRGRGKFDLDMVTNPKLDNWTIIE